MSEVEDFHDEVEIEDFEYDPENEVFRFPCPCGDLFVISKDDILYGEDVAKCPTCSLQVKVIYDPDELKKFFDKPKNKCNTALATN